ncbi:MAG: polysaccharide deacetylase [Verrucomicrobiaceae bacterium]|nr:polysaccharide deacetylase [Verrucomicrobiaceae bacterium]
MQRWRPSFFLKLSMVLHGAALLSFIVAPAQWRIGLIAIVCNHLLITAIGLWPRSNWLGSNWTRLPPAAAARNEIAITIDDGPDPDVTPQVLDILEQHGTVATFFCIGERAQRYPELCRDIARRGHALENHSQLHRHNFSLRGYTVLRREIDTAQRTLENICGERPQFFRAPAGLRNPFLDPVLKHCGLQLAAWTRRGFDTRQRDAQKVLKSLTHELAAGDILLLHDGHAARDENNRAVIVTVLPELLQAIRAAGLIAVTLRAAKVTH